MEVAWLAALGVLFLTAGLAALGYDSIRRRRGRSPYPFPDTATNLLDEAEVEALLAQMPRKTQAAPGAPTMSEPRPPRRSPALPRVSLPSLPVLTAPKIQAAGIPVSRRLLAACGLLGALAVASAAAYYTLSNRTTATRPAGASVVVALCPFSVPAGAPDPVAYLSTDLGQSIAEIPGAALIDSCRTPQVSEEQAAATRAKLDVDILVSGMVGASGQLTVSLMLDPSYAPPDNGPWHRWLGARTSELVLPTSFAIHLPLHTNAAPAEPLVIALAELHGGRYQRAAVAAAGAGATLAEQVATADGAMLVEAFARLALGDDAAALQLLDEEGARGSLPAEGLVLRARGLIDESDFTGANAALDRALAERTGSEQTIGIAHLLKARTLRLSADLSGSTSEADAALALLPDFPPAHYEKAQALYGLSQPDLARAELDALLRRDPQAAPAYSLMGLVSLMLGKPDSAQSSFARAQEIYGSWQATLHADEARAQLSGDTEAADEATRSIVAIDHELAGVHVYMAMALSDIARREGPESFFGGLWRKIRNEPTTRERAIAELQIAQKLDPARLDVFLQMATLYRDSGDLTKAQEVLKQAIELAPTSPEPSLALADLQNAQGDPQDAEATLNGLLDRAPGSFQAYEQLQSIYEQQKQSDVAKEVLQRGLAQPAHTTADHLWKGKFFTLLGDTQSAQAELQAAAVDPSLWEAHVLLGKLYEANGQTDDALSEYQAALRTQPNDPTALLEAAKLLVLAGHPDDADKLYSRLTSVVPNSAEGHIAYSQLLAGKGQAGRAIEEAKLAVQADDKRPDTHMALAQAYEVAGDWPNASAQYKAASERDPSSYEAFIHLAISLFREDRYDESMEASETASQLRPSDPQPYRWNAEARLARLDAAGALSQLGLALKLSPDMPEALALTARAYARQADWASAERYAQTAQSADQLSPVGDLAMGDVLLSENRPQEALQAFLQAQRVSAEPAEAITGQGRCYSSLGDRTKALTTFKSALENDPRFAPAHLYAGNALVEMGRWDDALSEYSLAVALRPRWPEALYYQGRAFVQREDLRSAAAAFKKATDQSPNLTDAWYGLGIADRGLGDQKGAIEALSAVTKLNVNNGEAWLYLGLTYEEVGDRVSARQAFENALATTRLDSTRTQAQQGLQRVR